MAVLGVILGAAVVTARWLPADRGWIILTAVLVPIVATLVRDIRKTLLALILLEIPLQLDTHFFYREDPAILGAIGGVGVSVLTLALGLLYLHWLVERLVRPDLRTVRHAIVAARPLLLYTGIMVLSLVVAQDRQLALFEIWILAQTLLLFVYLAHWIRTPDQILFVVTFLVLGLAVEGLIMISASFIGEQATFGIQAVRRADGRLGGPIGPPNYAASYLALLLPLAGGVLLARTTRMRKALAAFALVAGAVAVLLTQSRGGWIALVVAILLMSVGLFRRAWLSAPVAVAITGCGICAMVLAHGPIVTRLAGPDFGAAYSRIPLMVLALRMIADNFLLGVGANNFAIRMEDYATGWLSDEWLYTVHNKYLLVWAEGGILALIFFLVFLLVTIRRGWAIWRKGDALLSPLALGFTVAIVGHAVHLTVDVFNDRSHIEILWLYAAMLVALEGMMKAGSVASDSEVSGEALASRPSDASED